MKMTRVAALLLAGTAMFTNVSAFAAEDDESQLPLDGCSFRANPSEFLQAQSRVRQEIFENVRRFKSSGARSATVNNASAMVRKNFVDDEIFGQLETAGIPAADLTTDAEFVRRITLDLTGKLPTPSALREFVSSDSSLKREDLINRLLYSQEFSDKWSTWFADLIQNTERLSTSQRAPQVEGRNALDLHIRNSFQNNISLKQMVTDLLTGKGNNYFIENGPASYMVLWSTAMGPNQDTYDMLLSRTTAQFLGVAHYDCVLCHNGRGHLTGISAWGEKALRSDAQRMAASFSRVRLVNGAPAGARQYMDPLFNSTDVQDAATGTYDLNTNSGNRPNRVAVGTERSLTAEYRDGSKAPATGKTWRQFYAEKLVNDPMFDRNFANRLWKAFFGMGLVDPVDTLDPDRLDPKNPPPAPWTLQATHPELLEKLAKHFAESNGDLRSTIRLLVASNAYQLSSDYNYEWKYEYLTQFPRHYPRRLDAEEIIDAIALATGSVQRYTWPMVNNQTVAQGSALQQSDPVESAYKLPDVNEPRNNGAVLQFMASFLRGNRDTASRSTSGSIIQQLNMMNDNFITSRAKTTGTTASPVLAGYLKFADNGSIIDDMWLRFLGRVPVESERNKALTYMQRATNRNAAIEDLAWACMNKLDFLFSY
ncbi:MAG: DUF1553 domain-containing protein [Bryobacteraceae bacterium]|nr:DUF1553 domain-containing protein [Bryobacteraceae bacterium]